MAENHQFLVNKKLTGKPKPVTKQSLKRVKFFQEISSDEKAIEEKVNEFLDENCGDITVDNIKFNTVPAQSGQIWSVMIIYTKVEK